MNRTIKDATVKRYHYDSHDQLRQHLGDFVAAYNFARRLKTLKGLTPYEAICATWQKEPSRFTSDPNKQLRDQTSKAVCSQIEGVEVPAANLDVGLASG